MMKHKRGTDWNRFSNFATCSCGWRWATDYSSSGVEARLAWIEHTLEAMQEDEADVTH